MESGSKILQSLVVDDDLFLSFMSYLPGLATIKSTDGEYQFVNEYAMKLFGRTKPEILGKRDIDLWPEERARFYMDIDQEVLQSKQSIEFNEVLTINGKEFIFLTHRFPIDRSNDIICIGNLSLDITERRRVERGLQKARRELADKEDKLEKKNIALDELLGSIEKTRLNRRKNITANVEDAILPTIQKLRANLPDSQHHLLDLLENDIKEILSPFMDTLKHKYNELSPRELEICHLIKNGMISKEIGQTLNLALNTVHKHREMIRKKLGLTNRDINLNTFLKSSDLN